MLKSGSSRTVALLLSLSAFVPAALLCDAPAATPPEESFFEAVDVDVVSIEVVVTDREGRPVTGLTEEDFELFENGRKMTVTNFYAEEEGGASAGVGAAAVTTAEHRVPADDRRLSLAVFIDNRSLGAQSRNRVVTAMKGFLGDSRLSEEGLLFASYDGTLRVRRGTTDDPATLDDILAEIVSGSSGGEQVKMEMRRILNEMEHASLPVDPEERDKLAPNIQDASREEAQTLHATVRQFAEQRNDEVRRAIDALGQFVDSLAGLPGRKAVLFVSGGLPMRPAEPLLLAMQRKYRDNPELNQSSLLDALSYDATGDLRRLLAKANANRVTFYALAAPGEGVPGENPDRVWTPEMVSQARFNDIGPLQDLAGATGGFAALDPINPEPLLARMHGDLSTYYSLGYVSPEGKSGKTQKIAVKVRRPGVTVRHRENYLAKTGGERTRDRTYSAMLLGETRNPLGVAVDLGEQTRTAKGEIELEVTVRFPIANLVLLPSEHFHEGRVSVFIGSRDERGRSSRITQVFVPIRIPNEQMLTAMGQQAGYQTRLLLRPEPHQVAVGVRDELGNNDATLLADFTPTAGASARK